MLVSIDLFNVIKKNTFFCYQAGTTIPPSVAVGDEVMLPEFGGTKVTLEDKDYFLFREAELLAKMKSE